MVYRTSKSRQLARVQSRRGLDANAINIIKKNVAEIEKMRAVVEANGKLPYTRGELQELDDYYTEQIVRLNELSDPARVVVNGTTNVVDINKDIDTLGEGQKIVRYYLEIGENIDVSVSRDINAFYRRGFTARKNAARRALLKPFQQAVAKDSLGGILLRGFLNRRAAKQTATQRAAANNSGVNVASPINPKASGNLAKNLVDFEDDDEVMDMDESLNGNPNPKKTKRTRGAPKGKSAKRRARETVDKSEELQEKVDERVERRKRDEFAEGVFERLDKLIRAFTSIFGENGEKLGKDKDGGSDLLTAGAAAAGVGLMGAGRKAAGAAGKVGRFGKLARFAKFGGVLAAGSLAYDLIAGESSRGSKGEALWGDDNTSTLDSRGAGYGSAALGGAAIGAFAGPLGAAIGGVLGAAVYGIKDFWSDIFDSNEESVKAQKEIAMYGAHTYELMQQSNGDMKKIVAASLQKIQEATGTTWSQRMQMIAGSALSGVPGMGNGPSVSGTGYNPITGQSGDAYTSGSGNVNPINGQTLLQAQISSHESGSHPNLGYGYDAVLGDNIVKGTKGNFRPDGRNPSEMTFPELFDYQDGVRKRSGRLNSSAVGKYQYVKTTLKGLYDQYHNDPKKRALMQSYGINFDEGATFSPQNQDAISQYTIMEVRGGRKYKNGKISKEEFMNNLSQEWASVQNSSGRGTYGGQGAPTALSDDALYAADQKYAPVPANSNKIGFSLGDLNLGGTRYSDSDFQLKGTRKAQTYAPLVSANTMPVMDDISPDSSYLPQYAPPSVMGSNTGVNAGVTAAGGNANKKPGMAISPGAAAVSAASRPSIDDIPTLEDRNLMLVANGIISR